MGTCSNIEIVFIDLDGTLLDNEKKVGNQDKETLRKLGNLGIIRVFATGRTYYNSMQVLDDSIDFDFLIFSSGAGIFDWKNKKMLNESIIPRSKVVEIAKSLREMQMNFSVHFAIPENHKYHYFKSYDDKESDFNYRNLVNKKIAYKLNSLDDLSDATQFLVITMNLADLNKLNSKFPNMKTIRASSPIDGKSIWLEIFNSNVSKAKGAVYVCRKLNISQDKTLSIGNDYNDIDLLNWTNRSYVVENAPDDIKSNYSACCSNLENPLTDVYEKLKSMFTTTFDKT